MHGYTPCDAREALGKGAKCVGRERQKRTPHLGALGEPWVPPREERAGQPREGMQVEPWLLFYMVGLPGPNCGN